jgi:hypothetical protein
MAKPNKVHQPVAPAPAATPTAPAGAMGHTIGLTAAKVNFTQGSARALYHAVLAAHAGQPAAAFCAAIIANPPCFTKKGTVEPPMPYLRWFIRNGYATLTGPQS